MPSFDDYKVFINKGQGDNRPKCVFPARLLEKQSFRSVEFRDVARGQAEEDFEAARALAAEARTDFEEELKVRVAEAERRGHELGMQEAGAVHEEQRSQLVRRIEGALEAFHGALDRAEEAATRDALRLGLMVAERLVRVSLTKNPEALAATLAATVDKLEGSSDLKILADSEVAAQLQARVDELASKLGVSGITVEVGDDLQAGDLIVYRGSAALDARVTTQLRKLEPRLLKELGFYETAEDSE